MAETIGKVKEVNGEFEIVDENGNLIKLEAGQELQVGDEIQGIVQDVNGELQIVDENGNVVELVDGQSLELSDNSIVSTNNSVNENVNNNEDIVNTQSSNNTENSKPNIQSTANQNINTEVVDNESASNEALVEQATEQNITVELNNGQEVVVNNQNSLLLDPTVTGNEASSFQETVLDNNTLDSLENDLEDESNLVSENNDNSDDEGEEEEQVQSDSSKARELDRNADIADVQADLRESVVDVRADEFEIESDIITSINAEISIDGVTSVIEGNTATYSLSVTEVPSTDVVVNIIYSGIAIDGTDYTSVQTVTIPAGSKTVNFTIDTIDDYYAEGSEPYTLKISEVTGGGYDELGINPLKDSVTTNILDESTSTPEDTVYAVIEGPSHVQEGETTTDYTISLRDKDGNLVNVSSDTEVRVVFANGSAEDGDYEFGDGQTTTVTISAGSSSTTLSVDTNDDYYKEGDENYTVSIDNVDTDEFENIDKDGYTTTGGTTYTGSTDTIIYDAGSTPPTPLPPEDPDSADTVYVELSTNDSVEEQAGGTLTHNLDLVDKDGNAVNLANGETITVSLTYSSDTTEGEDFSTKQTSVTITGNGGSTYSFDNTIVEDFYQEGNESYTVSIGAITSPGTYFENVAVSGTQNSAIGTITDGTSGDKIPNEDVDTVYAVLSGPTTVNEGDTTTTYTVTLQDKDGNAVSVSSDTVVTVTFTNGSASDGDYEFGEGLTTTTTISSGGSSGTFTVDTTEDSTLESNENYSVAISNVNTTEFENLDIDGYTTTGGTTYVNSVMTTIVDDDDTIPVVFNEEARLDVVKEYVDATEKTNVIIILDSSGSMGTTRMNIAKDAVKNVIDTYDGIGDVQTLLVDFDATATAYDWNNATDAKSLVDSFSSGGNTNYEDATKQAIDKYGASTPPAADKTIMYFITDGTPTAENTDGGSATNIGDGNNYSYFDQDYYNNWNTFISNSIDELNVIGIGTGLSGSNANYINLLNTSNGVDATVSSDSLDTFTNILLNNLTQTVSGTMDNIDYKSNTPGSITSIKIGSTTYNAVDGNLTDIATPEGGKLTFNFSTGAYSYSILPSDVSSSTVVESFLVTVSDSDLDTATGNLTINIDAVSKVPPAKPEITSITDTNDGDVTTVTISGTAENNVTIDVYSSQTLLGTTISDGSGNWSLDYDFTSGVFAIVAKATNGSGKISQASDISQVFIDNDTVNINGNEVDYITNTNNANMNIDAGAGADVIKTGSGNDTITFDKDDILVDGGAGTDSLILDTGIDVDFSTLGTDNSNDIIDNIEKIDLSENGNHDITKLTMQDIIDMTDSNNLLEILGDAGDSVELKNDSNTWSTDNVVDGDGNKTYINTGDNSVSLKIDQDITTTII